MNIICVQITLNGGNGKGLNFQLVFTHQPSVEDILDGFNNTPALFKREDYELYAAKLKQGLYTYGVPKLDVLLLKDEADNPLRAELLTCTWHTNVEGPELAVDTFPYGKIVVARRNLIHNQPVAGAPDTKKKGK